MTNASTSAVGVSRLRTDHADNPLGIDEPRPNFSWQLIADRRDVCQRAYRVTVWNEDATGNRTVWDSGWVAGTTQLGVQYLGTALEDRTRYAWQVRVRIDDGTEVTSERAYFETAFLSDKQWSAQWLACVAMSPDVSSPLFRNEFELSAEVARARVYVSGIGYYELFVNGQRVGDSVLDPAWTDYRSRVFYATYDVTEQLREGGNALGVALGNGWFQAVPAAVESQLQPQFTLELHAELADGSHVRVSSAPNAGWLSTIEGPIVYNSVYGGESYDARREIPGWSEPGRRFLDADALWVAPLPVEPPGGSLRAQPLEPIQVVATIEPVTVRRLGPDRHVVDFGQNFAGWVRIRLGGTNTNAVTLQHAELANADGTINRVNLRTAAATDSYVIVNSDSRWYEPHFTYHGFRYVQIDGYEPDIAVEDIQGRVVRSAVEQIGRFHSDNELLNRIHQNVVWTEASNLHGLPTDCPQRDERLAWLNDMTVRGEQAVHNFGLARLYGKWFTDILDTQGDVTGAIADTAPFVRYGHRPADPVVSSFLLVPWLMRLHYGEARWIEEHYNDLGRWVSYLASLRVDGIIEQSQIGDWAPPVSEAVEGSAGSGARSALTPGGLISTGFLYLNLNLMREFATFTNRGIDAERFEREAAAVREAINSRYLNMDTGNYGPGNQASNGFALYLGIVPAHLEERVLEALIQDIVAHDYHLTTGNLCTKYVMDVLGQRGKADIALKLLTQRTYPSWGYMIDQGATTIWERWEHVTGGVLAGMGSHNHPMYGSVDSWFYRYLAGIMPDSSDPGFGNTAIEPTLPDGLDFVDCSLETPRGILRSAWAKTGNSARFSITVPPNATASVLLPAPPGAAVHESGLPLSEGKTMSVLGVRDVSRERSGLRVRLGSGTYDFEVTA